MDPMKVPGRASDAGPSAESMMPSWSELMDSAMDDIYTARQLKRFNKQANLRRQALARAIEALERAKGME
jgi:hypothetical protein